MTSPDEAARIAERLLALDLPRRWQHSRGVARAAQSLAALAGADAQLLEAAAWLHDVGYAPAIAATGFHPTDGAAHLQTLGLDGDLVALVARHTNSEVEADERGITALLEPFPAHRDRVRRVLPLLTYCDLTTSPDGDTISIDVRLADIYDRYAPADAVHRAIRRGEGNLRRVHAEVTGALSRNGSVAPGS
ncbi:MAG: HD domain-containing protein [Actinobacteria bacterium]|nr:HD domain-containing protein [Actinomycetota bacterium]